MNRRILSAFLAALLLAGCGGGGSGAGSPISPINPAPPVAPGSRPAAAPVGKGQRASQVKPNVGKVVLVPASMTLTDSGLGSSRTVSVSQATYGGTYTESDNCSPSASPSPPPGTATATVVPMTNGGGRATFAVTGTGAGTACTATFTGGSSLSASLPITVVTAGSVVLSPTT